MEDTGVTFDIRKACWMRDRAALEAIRHDVFVVEQQVPVDLEWDGLDESCTHLLAVAATGRPIGCARLLPDGHVGRMAVLRPWRGQGVGRALLRAAVAGAQAAGVRTVRLNAQVHALGFYEREGFEPFGEEFIDAGIAHRAMQRVIARA